MVDGARLGELEEGVGLVDLLEICLEEAPCDTAAEHRAEDNRTVGSSDLLSSAQLLSTSSRHPHVRPRRRNPRTRRRCREKAQKVSWFQVQQTTQGRVSQDHTPKKNPN